MRSALIARFRLLTRDLGRIERVLVVGGSSTEPELNELSPTPDEIVFLNLSPQTGAENDIVWDLNVPTQAITQAQLVICNQVLEHVWNHESFFDAVVDSAAQRGLIWLTCPASNFEHASPDYYSPGFSAEYLRKNLEVRGVDCLEHGEVSSKRAYVARHIFSVWLDEDEVAQPWRSLFRSNHGSKRPMSWLRRRVVIFLVGLLPNAKGSRWAVESYAFGSKKAPS